MFLIQLLLPLYDNEGQAFPPDALRAVVDHLADRFGGLTAHTRAPAAGLWVNDRDETRRDDVVVYEVMTDTLDRAWWAGYRHALERRFRQERIVVRVTRISVL